MRFADLEHSNRVPDAKTIWTWRERLKQAGLMEEISAAVDAQLQRAGLVARGGQLIDASIVPAPVQRNTREENARIKQGEVPQGWSQAKRAQKDVDARWTKKHGKSDYGDKLHVNVDRRNGLIRKYEVSPANEHDSQHFETLLDSGNPRKRVSADSAYASKSREAALKAQGIQADICHKGTRDHPLSAAGQRRNHRIAKDRVFVEHVFARISQQGGKCLRTIGLARARVVIGLKVAMHNLLHLARTLQPGTGAPA